RRRARRSRPRALPDPEHRRREGLHLPAALVGGAAETVRLARLRARAHAGRPHWAFHRRRGAEEAVAASRQVAAGAQRGKEDHQAEAAGMIHYGDWLSHWA